MKKFSIAAIVVAALSLGASGWVLRSYDETTTPEQGPSPTTTTATTTTTVPIVVVPTEVGKTAMVAAGHLHTVNLKWKLVSPVASVTTAKYNVVSQSPLPGTEVPEGTVIELTLSSGPP